MSHPVWVRGLKLVRSITRISVNNVAPRVGAWIETLHLCGSMAAYPVAPRVGAWIETYNIIIMCTISNVAPRVGAWIETLHLCGSMAAYPSHPVWVRGLKLSSVVESPRSLESHPVWVRGLKQ